MPGPLQHCKPGHCPPEQSTRHATKTVCATTAPSLGIVDVARVCAYPVLVMRLPPSHIQLPEWHVFGRQKLETRVHSWILCRSSKCCFANLGHKAGAFERNVLSCRLTRTLSSLTFLRKHPSTHAGATCAPSSTCYVRQQIGCHLMFNCLSNTFLPSSAAGSPDSFDSEQIEESY